MPESRISAADTGSRRHAPGVRAPLRYAFSATRASARGVIP